MRNTPDIDGILLDVRRAIATAKLAEFERQCFRLGELVGFGFLAPPSAADLLRSAAAANGLLLEHGEDEIQRLMIAGLSA